MDDKGYKLIRLRTYIQGFVSLLVPGCSLVFASRTHLGILVPTAGLVWTFTFSLLRWIITLEGFVAFLLGLAFLHISSLFYGVYLLKANNFQAPRKKYVCWSFLALLVLNLSIVLGSHYFKKNVYGFELFFIPSVSMQPTLFPGDIIMVDTWPKIHSAEAIGKVLVFRKSKAGVAIVKRVHDVKMEYKGLELFYQGDNESRSIDSRTFGWINHELIVGEVKFVFFSFNHKTRFFIPIIQ